MSNMWQGEDEEPFEDRPDEINFDASGAQQEAPPVNVKVARPATPAVPPPAPAGAPVIKEELVDELETEESDDYTDVLSDARLRLEQGRLYEMVMNNDLFSGSEGDPKAVKNVQREIREFARERMEIMLGMRAEQPQVDHSGVVSSPFNDLEVEALKALAAAATKGATQTPEAQSQNGSWVEKQSAAFKPISLNNGSKPKPAPAKVIAKPLPKKAAAPIKRAKNEDEIEQILAEEGVTREELDATFSPNYKPLGVKSVHQLTEEQIIERNRQAKLRLSRQQVKNPSAIPMPTSAQEEMMHTARANQAAAHPQMQNIMRLLNEQPKKKV